MKGEIRLLTPLSSKDAEKLKMGDKVLLSGIIYTARDAAHKRLVEMLKRGEELPFNPEGKVIPIFLASKGVGGFSQLNVKVEVDGFIQRPSWFYIEP